MRDDQWYAYAPPLPAHASVAEPGVRVRHPLWLLGSAVAALALVIFTGTALTRGAQPRQAVRWPVIDYAQASSLAVGDAPVIDTTTAKPAVVEPAGPPDPPRPAKGNYVLTGAPSISVAQIESVLKKYGSPAVGKGQALYDLGVRYGVDPAFALAFFVHESGCGTRGVARSSRSIGNIRWTEGYGNFEGYRSYPTWEAGMEDWYKLITDLYINGWNLRTVDAIIPVYAPAADHNSPPTYINSVKSLVDSWRGN